MKKLFGILVPGWDRMSRVQRLSCVDFGVSFVAALLLCCSESVFLTLLGVANLVRSYVWMLDSGVEIDD